MATKDKVKQGTHLTVITRADGTVDLKWDWNALLAEVAAIATPKINLVANTEAKVTKSRAKKVVKDQITDAVTTKKKPAVNKAVEKKSPAKAPAKKPAAKKLPTKAKKA